MTMKTALPKRHYKLQLLVIVGALGGVIVLGQAYQRHNEAKTRAYYTEIIGRDYGEAMQKKAMSQPFSLRDLYDRAESVGESVEDSTVWEIEAEITAARQARLIQVVKSAQASGNPTEFLDTQITNNLERLAAILGNNDGIPEKHRPEYFQILNELNIFYRARSEVDASRNPSPIIPNPQRIRQVKP
jgi:hypothetical protein